MTDPKRPYEDWTTEALKDYEERLYDQEVAADDVWFERDQVLRELNYRDFGVTITIHKTPEAVPKCGSYEVRYSDGRPSRFFYYDDEPSRRLRPDQVDSETALSQAREFARVERDK